MDRYAQKDNEMSELPKVVNSNQSYNFTEVKRVSTKAKPIFQESSTISSDSVQVQNLEPQNLTVQTKPIISEISSLLVLEDLAKYDLKMTEQKLKNLKADNFLNPSLTASSFLKVLIVKNLRLLGEKSQIASH